jgi:hypothetical protein
MRFGQILGIGITAAVLLVPGAASAAPCVDSSAPGERPAIPSEPFRLARPSQIAAERSSYARLISYPTPGLPYLAATFDYLAQDGSVMESRVLTVSELDRISDVDSLERTGSYPFELHWTVELELGTRCGGCSGEYYGNWLWTGRDGIIPGLRSHGSFVALELFPVGRPRSRTYRLDVAWNRRRLSRSWLRTTVGQRHPSMRVPEGTDDLEDCVQIRPDLVRTDQSVQLFCRRPTRRDPRTILNRAFGCPRSPH